MGARREREGLDRKIKRTDKEIDELAYGLYGVTETERQMVQESLGQGSEA